MATFIENITHFLKTNGILSRLITINIAVFLIIHIIRIIEHTFGLHTDFLLHIELPSDPGRLIFQLWSPVTYMFTHYDFFHLLFNMLWLYWFGKIFLLFFNSKQLSSLYIIGGLAGAAFFILSYNVFPYFNNMVGTSYLIGASAAVMAIVFGAAFYRKDFEIGILFLGNVKIIYIAIASLLIDILLSIKSDNSGGHIAHIGGALTGIAYSYFLTKNGKDITSWLSILLDKLSNMLSKKPAKMKVTYNRFESNYDYNARKNEENKEIDRILDKIKQSGYSSLTEAEKKKLFDAK